MEVIVKKLHNVVDKFASLNAAGDVIHYTEKCNPKLKRTIDLAEGKRIFEDLYGVITTRWEVAPAFAVKQARQAKRAHRNKGQA